MIQPKVLLAREGHVLIITINRPSARNSVDAEVALAVGRAVEEADADESIRVLILTGAGDQSFSAGADLKALSRGERMLPKGYEHWSFAGFVHHFTSKPTIAAVNGTALGGGAELALAADLVVAAEHAVFGLPEVKRGLIAAGGGAIRLARQLPRKIALELLLTGESISAAEALRWGLVNRVVPAADLLTSALELASAIAANAPLAVQASKRLAYGIDTAGSKDPEAALWALNDQEAATVFTSLDAREGPLAFAEKRSPVWQSR